MNAAASASTKAQALKSTLVIRNLPRPTLVSDVRRMLERHRIENVKDVHLDYRHFLPLGKAYVTFTRPAFLQSAYHRLRSAQMSGMNLDVSSTGDINLLHQRTRGAEGRGEAMMRGAVFGNGPDAGITEHGKNVVMWGFPGRYTIDNMRSLLKDFRLANTEDGQEDILKMQYPGRQSITSRHYVRTASAIEAHRMVRRFHMFLLDHHGREFLVRARVVY